MLEFEKFHRKADVRVRMIRMMEEKIKELDDVFGDMLDDLACDLGLGPVEDEVQSEKRYDEYCGLEADVIDQAKKQFGQNMMGNMVWAVVSFSPQVGVEVEFFGDRPHTADGDPSNWPKWFRVYEGNINGGDSILTDARGMGIR